MECSTRDQLCQYYGSMEIGGDLIIRKGKYSNSLAGDSRIKGDVRILEEGWLHQKIYEGKGMEVGGDVLIDSRKSSSLECGRLAVHGNLNQMEEAAEDSLVIGSGFTLACCGNKMQTIDLPGVDEIPDLDLSQSKAVRLMQDFSGSYLYGIEKILTEGDTLYIDYSYADTSSDGSIDGNLKCFGMLSVNGHHLTIKGKYTQYGGTRINENGKLTITGDYTADQGILSIDQAEVHVKGNTRIKKDAAINMFDQENCLFRADGNFVSNSRNTSYNSSVGGTLELQGDLIKKEHALSFGLCLSKTRVVFKGTDPQKVQVPESQKFGMADYIDVRNSNGVDFGSAVISARQITGFSGIRAEGALVLQDSRVILTQDESYSGDLILYDTYLDCNGYQFYVSDISDLEQSGGVVNLDHGTLCVSGNYSMMCDSILQMIRPDDLLQVQRDFSTDSTMNHSSMLRDGRMELWGNFNQSGDYASFGSSENFVIAFKGNGQKAHFDNIDYSQFANIDPEYRFVAMDDEIQVFAGRMVYRFAKGFLGGLQEALGIDQLNATAVAFLAGFGITLQVAGPLMPAVIVGLGGLAFSLLIAINSAYNLAKSAGGIYSTVTGAGTSYDKAEAFAHDAALMMMSVFFLKGAVVLGTKSLSTCKSVVQDLIGRTTRVKPLEVIQGAKGIETITSLEEFLECVKGFLDEDALQYAKELLGNDADDIVELKKIARLMEEGSRKIGKKLSKEEFKAGLDALWGDGGVEGALWEIERYSKWGKLIESVNDLTLEQREAFTKYTGDAYENINNSLRGLEEATAENQETINIMKSTLDNASLSRDMVLYRGTSREELGILKNLSPEDLIQKEIGEPAFISTSTRKRVAQEGFLGNLQMKIEAPRGSKALDISSISYYGGESEILFNLGQKLRITAAREEAGVLYITVTIE